MGHVGGRPRGRAGGALAGAHGHRFGGGPPMVIETAEPGLTAVPGGGVWLSTRPRWSQNLSATLATVPRTRPAACRTWPAWAWVSPARAGTMAGGCGTWTAKLALTPAATWVAVVRPVTCTGPVTGVVVPMPSSPLVLSPQASTVPPDFS